MARSTAGSGTRLGGPRPFNGKTIEQLPNDRPALYVLERSGKPLYAGVAQRGRLQERLKEHLDAGDVRGATRVRVRAMPSIDEARQAEEQFIKREKPPGNEQHNPDR